MSEGGHLSWTLLPRCVFLSRGGGRRGLVKPSEVVAVVLDDMESTFALQLVWGGRRLDPGGQGSRPLALIS